MTDTAPPAGDLSFLTSLVEIVVDQSLTREAAARPSSRLSDALRLRPAQLVVDLSGRGYAEALAIDVLLTAHQRAFQNGGRLTLGSPSPPVTRLLHLAQVHRVTVTVAA